MRKLLMVSLLGLLGCAGKPSAGCFQAGRATTYAPVARPEAEGSIDSAAARVPDSASVEPKAEHRPSAPSRSHRLRAARAAQISRAVGRRLTRARAVVAHAPVSHAADGLAYLFWAALILLGVIILGAVLIHVLADVALGVIGAWVLFGLLAAAALYLGYAAFG